jgi:TetR/AcrR family transcriptional regulator, cholesterol catabolism regulator
MEATEKILRKASEMFMVLGVRNVTMDGLAAELNVSKRTIYELFLDKDNLFIESIKYLILENNKELVLIINESENVIDAFFTITRLQQQRRKNYPKVFLEDINRYFKRMQTAFFSCPQDLKKFSASFVLLEKGLKEGLIRPEINIEIVDNFIHEVIAAVHTSERLSLLGASDEDLFSNIMLPYFRGICTPKGAQLIDGNINKTNSTNQSII